MLKSFLQKLKIILLSTITIFLFLVYPVLADGMVIPPQDYWVQQTDQQAVIYYQNETEILVLSTSFNGNAGDFAWIIPFPSEPQIEQAREELFDNLAQLTQQTYRIQNPIMYSLGLEADTAAGAKVVVWSTAKIDIFDITTLSATDSDALQRWLNKHDYPYPTQYTYLFNDYINRGWFFVAIKVDTSVDSAVANQLLKAGHSSPLKFTFTTKQPIYPMKISQAVSQITPSPTPTPTPFLTPSITPTPTPTLTPIPTPTPTPTRYITPYPLPLDGSIQSEQSPPSSGLRDLPSAPVDYYRPISNYLPVTLYVFTSHKTQASGFTTQYAGWLLPDQINKLSVDTEGKSWVEAKGNMYLTKLYRNYYTNNISDDVVLIKADNNETVGAGQQWVMPRWKLWIFILSPLALELIIITMIILLEIKSVKKITKE